MYPVLIVHAPTLPGTGLSGAELFTAKPWWFSLQAGVPHSKVIATRVLLFRVISETLTCLNLDSP